MSVLTRMYLGVRQGFKLVNTETVETVGFVAGAASGLSGGIYYLSNAMKMRDCPVPRNFQVPLIALSLTGFTILGGCVGSILPFMLPIVVPCSIVAVIIDKNRLRE